MYVVNPLTAESIYREPSTECAKPINRLTIVKGSDFMEKMTMMKSHTIYILIFLCIFDGFLNYECFFVDSLPNCPTGRPESSARTIFLENSRL